MVLWSFALFSNGHRLHLGKLCLLGLFAANLTSSLRTILTFSYPSEILKFSQRARGLVVSQAIGYLVGIMMTYTMPIAISKISWKYYVINAASNVPMVFVIWRLFPKTKGKTLEEVDIIFEGIDADNWLRTEEPVIDGQEVLKSIDQTKSHDTKKTPSVA